MKSIGARTWISFLLIGLTGQFAWTIENMYFNVYLYNTISTNPNHIAVMVAASAVIATLTTLLMGALSDRIGILAGGKLRAVGAAAELLARTGTERFEDAFVALAEGGSI